jgi:hypothetical protein
VFRLGLADQVFLKPQYLPGLSVDLPFLTPCC